MSRPWLSVLMPTCNGATYLAAALDSILRQADPGVEIIAVDDNSTDGTIPILESFAKRLPLTIIRHARTGNWASNTNDALAQSQGDYVCFLHQDDLWLPRRLSTMKPITEAAPKATMLLHASWFIGTRGERLGVWRCPLPPWRLLSPALVVERLLVQNFIAAPAPLFRRDVALRSGGLDPALWYAADWDLWLKLAAAGPTVYCPRPLTGFRIHPLSQTVVRGGQIDGIRWQLQRVFEKHFAVWTRCSPGIRQVRREAEFAQELNVQLFAGFQGCKVFWRKLARYFVSLGPAGWHRFFYDSRIVERVLARVRGGFLCSARSRTWPQADPKADRFSCPDETNGVFGDYGRVGSIGDCQEVKNAGLSPTFAEPAKACT